MTNVPPAPTITFVQSDGARLRVAVRVGVSLMEAALRAGVPGGEARCRGNCACVTCHVHIDPACRPVLGGPAAMEESTLDLADGADSRSRLARQVRVTSLCDGLIVEAPAEQRVLGF